MKNKIAIFFAVTSISLTTGCWDDSKSVDENLYRHGKLWAPYFAVILSIAGAIAGGILGFRYIGKIVYRKISQ
ncbi:MAG: hypothetical protein R3B84_10820 [Zavarzinella sp.]